MENFKAYLKRNAYDLKTLKVDRENDKFIVHRAYNKISHVIYFFLEEKDTGDFFKTQRLNEPAKKIKLSTCDLTQWIKGA